jgi:hypothetical protein
MTEDKWEAKRQTLVEFHIPVKCDDPDCETPLIVLAVRTAGTTGEDLAKERPNWKPHDLICPNDHKVSTFSLS